jgi:Polyketide cyclase / dehydrase and lipid transport
MTHTFHYTRTVDTDVSPAAIWSLYEDVETWPSWDAQAERVTRVGPFATGSSGTMKFRGQDPLHYRLTKVEPLREFVDETALGEIVVRVSHRLEPFGDGRMRVTYAAEVDGPREQAEELGALITADFPDTMASLIALARERSR